MATLANGRALRSKNCLKCQLNVDDNVSIQCRGCKRSCHSSCLGLKPVPLLGDIFWEITCNGCQAKATGNSSTDVSKPWSTSRRMVESWDDVTHLLLNCLHQKYPNKKYFHVENQIIRFWEENSKRLYIPEKFKRFGQSKRKTLIHEALNKNVDGRFCKDSKVKQTAMWGSKDFQSAGIQVVDLTDDSVKQPSEVGDSAESKTPVKKISLVMNSTLPHTVTKSAAEEVSTTYHHPVDKKIGSGSDVKSWNDRANTIYFQPIIKLNRLRLENMPSSSKGVQFTSLQGNENFESQPQQSNMEVDIPLETSCVTGVVKTPTTTLGRGVHNWANATKHIACEQRSPNKNKSAGGKPEESVQDFSSTHADEQTNIKQLERKFSGLKTEHLKNATAKSLEQATVSNNAKFHCPNPEGIKRLSPRKSQKIEEPEGISGLACCDVPEPEAISGLACCDVPEPEAIRELELVCTEVPKDVKQRKTATRTVLKTGSSKSLDLPKRRSLRARKINTVAVAKKDLKVNASYGRLSGVKKKVSPSTCAPVIKRRRTTGGGQAHARKPSIAMDAVFNGSYKKPNDTEDVEVEIDFSDETRRYDNGLRLACLSPIRETEADIKRTAIKAFQSEAKAEENAVPSFWRTKNRRGKRDLTNFDSYYVSGKRTDETGVKYQVVWKDGNKFDSEDDEEPDCDPDCEDCIDFEDYDFSEYFFDKMPVELNSLDLDDDDDKPPVAAASKSQDSKRKRSRKSKPRSPSPVAGPSNRDSKDNNSFPRNSSEKASYATMC